MTLIFGAIADDLTGGMELAAMLVGQGVRCGFVTDIAELKNTQDCEAIVVALKIRLVPAEDAVAQATTAARALLSHGARQIFYKYCATFDSTDEGNIGPVTDSLASLCASSKVLFCSAFPDAGCLVFAGHQFRGTTLISETDKRFDPATPMTDPDLRRVLGRQTLVPVGLIRAQSILRGADAVQKEIEQEVTSGRRYLIADTLRSADLTVLARIAVDMPLLTGNSSIAEYLPPLWRAQGWCPDPVIRPALPPVTGSAVVLSGSCAARTMAQLDAFSGHGKVLYLDLNDKPEALIAHSLAFVRARHGAPCAVATSAASDAVQALQVRFGREGAAARADALFAALAPRLIEMGVRRLLVAGGETSGTVVRALGITRLQVGPYGGPGVGTAVTKGPDPLALCLKSGKLGPVDMLAPTLASMAEGAPAHAG